MTKKTLRVQPISGKFVSITINGKNIDIWLVDPDTNKQGTEIPYADAITALTLRHPLVCLVQELGKDGKYVKQITDEEEAMIKKMAEEHAAGIEATPAVPVENQDTSTLQALVNTQAALLQTQAVQNDEMKSQMAEMQKTMIEMQKQMAEMQKTSTKTKKSEE